METEEGVAGSGDAIKWSIPSVRSPGGPDTLAFLEGDSNQIPLALETQFTLSPRNDFTRVIPLNPIESHGFEANHVDRQRSRRRVWRLLPFFPP